MPRPYAPSCADARSVDAASGLNRRIFQRLIEACGMPDVAPHRLHISRHYGLIRSTERPARRMGDLRRQVSWLAAQASVSDLPAAPTWSASGICGVDLPLTVAGAASASKRRLPSLTVFPFHSLRLLESGRIENRHTH